MSVDVHISDLFFNSTHAYDESAFDPWIDLRDEAETFLTSLDGLGIPTPSVESLMNDYRERI